MKIDIVSAWKDEEYFENLSEQEMAQIPENPVGEVDLSDEDLVSVVGGGGTQTCCQAISVCVNSVLCSVIC